MLHLHSCSSEWGEEWHLGVVFSKQFGALGLGYINRLKIENYKIFYHCEFFMVSILKFLS